MISNIENKIVKTSPNKSNEAPTGHISQIIMGLHMEFHKSNYNGPPHGISFVPAQFPFTPHKYENLHFIIEK